MEQGWRIELLGELRVRRGDQIVSRFPKQLAALLVAYLACHPQHPHPRDALLEALCPDLSLDDARNSLRVALHLLRRLLEPPDAAAAEPLLIADRHSMRLNPTAFTTDLAEFEAALRAAARASSLEEQLSHLAQAVELYRGELLAGFTDEWVFAERQHLAEEYLEALHRLVSGFEQQGELERALEYGRRAVLADPLREEAHYDLMRLYAAAGQPSACLQQYQELERLLREELNEKPSAAARALAEELRRNARTLVVARSPSLIEPPAPSPPLPPPVPSDSTAAPLVAPACAPRLPPQFTRFFGREEEIARVTQLLAPGDEASSLLPASQLVTLTGPGGSGKTRLAIAVTGRLQAAFGGAVAFVPLAEVTDPARIADTIADALGLIRSGEVEPLEQVVEALRSQPWLLVLDNFEQLVEAGASVVRTLLERSSELTCLVTSRQRLNLAGEQEFAVLPLPTPRSGVQAVRRSGVQDRPRQPDFGPAGPEHPNTRTPEHLMSFPSVQLFVDRARAVRPDFQVTEANAAAVAALCDRLEGLPLALELAAARIPMLTPAQMLQHLEQRFELLVSRQRDLPARHRTLRAAVEGSYQLLAPELRRLLARLSVFRGGWTLEAAEVVCGGGEGVQVFRYSGVQDPAKAGSSLSSPEPLNTRTPEHLTLDGLEQLREASLVLAEEQGDGYPPSGWMRYGLLETLREYAWERLAESGELNAVRDRHRDWFLHLAEQAEVEMRSSGQAATVRARLEAELDNFRAALAWCLGSGVQAFRASGVQEGTETNPFLPHPERLNARPEGTRPERPSPAEAGLRLATALWWLWMNRGYLAEVQQWLEAALARSQPVPSPLRTTALLRAANLAGNRGDRGRLLVLLQAARQEQERVLTLARREGDRRDIASALVLLAEVTYNCDDPDATWSSGVEARQLFEELGDPSGVADTLQWLTRIAFQRGDRQAARALLEERLAVCRQRGEAEALLHALGGLGHLERDERNYDRARALYQESLLLRREIGHQFALAMSLEDFAVLAGREGQAERAVRLLGAAEAFCETLGAQPPVADSNDYERTVAAGRAALGMSEAGGAFAAAWADGRALSLDQALEYALDRSLP